MFEAFNRGVRVPAELLGELPDRSDLRARPQALREVIDGDGYAMLRGLLPVADVMAAREEITARLAAVGEIAEPAIDAVITGTSRRQTEEPDLGAFWKSVSEGRSLRRVTHGDAVRGLMSDILRGPVIGHDLVYLRVAPPGRALDLHYDYPFFTRATKELYTLWIPLGEVPVSDGPLFMVEGSNRYRDLLDDIVAVDQSRPPARKLAYDQPARDFAAGRQTRLLTTNFQPGDVVVFSLLTAHGSFDNCSPINRARLSCDLRYQRADAPRDDRFFGPAPTGVTGNGYSDLNGAKPLTEPWQTR